MSQVYANRTKPYRIGLLTRDLQSPVGIVHTYQKIFTDVNAQVGDRSIELVPVGSPQHWNVAQVQAYALKWETGSRDTGRLSAADIDETLAIKQVPSGIDALIAVGQDAIRKDEVVEAFMLSQKPMYIFDAIELAN